MFSSGIAEFVEALLQSSYDATPDQGKWIFERLGRSNNHKESGDGGLGKHFGKSGTLGIGRKATHPLVSAAFDIDFKDESAKIKKDKGVENLYVLAQAYKTGAPGDKSTKVDAIEKNDNKYAVCLALIYFYTNDKSKLEYHSVENKDFVLIALNELKDLYTTSPILKGKKLKDPDQGSYIDQIELNKKNHLKHLNKGPEDKKAEGSSGSSNRNIQGILSTSNNTIVSSVLPSSVPLDDKGEPNSDVVPGSPPEHDAPDIHQGSQPGDIEMDFVPSQSSVKTPQTPEEKVKALVETMKLSGVGMELEDKIMYERLAFINGIKDFDIETLRFLSNHMNRVQHGIVKEPQFDDVRTEVNPLMKMFGKSGNTPTWQKMRHAVKREILDKRSRMGGTLTSDELVWLPTLFGEQCGRVPSYKTTTTKLLEISFPEVKLKK